MWLLVVALITCALQMCTRPMAVNAHQTAKSELVQTARQNGVEAHLQQHVAVLHQSCAGQLLL
jgi:hypothetical protein